jgi:hypothetical protein
LFLVLGVIARSLAADTARHCGSVSAPVDRIDRTASGGAAAMIGA